MLVMRRRTFVVLVSSMVAPLVSVLPVAAGLLIWGYSFTKSQLTSQLLVQKITCTTLVMLILSLPGFWHLRRPGPDAALASGGHQS